MYWSALSFTGTWHVWITTGWCDMSYLRSAVLNTTPALCMVCRMHANAFAQSLEQKSRFIKLRWGSLQELAQYDKTSAFMFYPKSPPPPFKHHNRLLWTCSKNQLKKCKQAVHACDPENITKAAKIYYNILSKAFLLSHYTIQKPTGERGYAQKKTKQ